MSEKYAIADYLVNLMGIMSGKEDAGRAKGNTLAEEYNRTYSRLTDLIKKEQEDAARQSELKSASDEERTDFARR